MHYAHKKTHALCTQGTQEPSARLLHEHAVVALGGHAGVREADDVAKAVDRQVALPAAALAARRPRLLHPQPLNPKP